jgi:hypothetical protein
LLSLVHFSYPFGLIKKWSFWSGSQSLFFRSWGQRTQCTNATIFFHLFICAYNVWVISPTPTMPPLNTKMIAGNCFRLNFYTRPW